MTVNIEEMVVEAINNKLSASEVELNRVAEAYTRFVGDCSEASYLLIKGNKPTIYGINDREDIWTIAIELDAELILLIMECFLFNTDEKFIASSALYHVLEKQWGKFSEKQRDLTRIRIKIPTRLFITFSVHFREIGAGIVGLTRLDTTQYGSKALLRRNGKRWTEFADALEDKFRREMITRFWNLLSEQGYQIRRNQFEFYEGDDVE